jgi:hypothetical protein
MPPRKAHTLWPNKGPLKKPRVVDTEKLLCGRSCVCSIAARPMNVFLLCVSSLKLPESEAERAEAVVEEADGGETIRLGDGDDEKNWRWDHVLQEPCDVSHLRTPVDNVP